MPNNIPQSSKDDLEFKVLYWLIIIITIATFACSIGSCLWFMWIVTKAVTQ